MSGFAATFTPNIMGQGKKLLIRRREKGSYSQSDGFFDKGAKKEFTIVASVQPLTGMEVLQVVEGDRAREHINIWTTGDLKKDDTVFYNCREFEVQMLEEWENQHLHLVHKKARAVLKDVNKEGIDPRVP